KKLGLIKQLAAALGPQLSPAQPKPPPTDQQDVAALFSAGISLTHFATANAGPGAEGANRLSGLLLRLATADPATRHRVATAVVGPLQMALFGLKEQLKAQPVTVASLPADLKGDWLASDGRARVQVLPKRDPTDTTVLRDFVKAITAAAPEATGPAELLNVAAKPRARAFLDPG